MKRHFFTFIRNEFIGRDVCAEEFVLSANRSGINIKHLTTGYFLLEETVNNKIFTSKFIKK